MECDNLVLINSFTNSYTNSLQFFYVKSKLAHTSKLHGTNF